MTLNLDQVFSDAPAIEGISAAHHFHVSNGAAVAYPLSKDVSATMMANCTLVKFSHSKEIAIRFPV